MSSHLHPSAGNQSVHPSDPLPLLPEPPIDFDTIARVRARALSMRAEWEAEKAAEREALTAAAYDHEYCDLVGVAK